MDLATFIKKPGTRKALAEAVGCNHIYLWQIAKGWRGRRPSAALAKRISDATLGVVSAESLLWGKENKDG